MATTSICTGRMPGKQIIMLKNYEPPTFPVVLSDGTSVRIRSVNRADIVAAVIASPAWPEAAALIGDKTDITDWSEADQIRALLLVLSGAPDVLVRIVASVTGEPVDVVARLPIGIPLRILEAALPA